MLRPAAFLVPLSGLLCHRASTLESLHQLPVSYEATWLITRPEFHRLAVPSLARRATNKKDSFVFKNERVFFVLFYKDPFKSNV